MPQFNPEWFASQLLWLAITFVVLYLLMSRIALPRMSSIVEGRQQKIENDLHKAEELRNEAQGVRDEYQRQLQEARGEAQKILRETEEAVTRENNDRLATFNRDMDARVRQAEERIEASKTEALSTIDEVAAETARAAANRLIGTRVGEAHAKKAVQAVRERSE